MRRGARILIPALLFLFPLVSAAQTGKITSVEKVVDGVWMAQTDQGVNAGWFLVGDDVVAVDAGNDAATGKALLDKIQETAGKPVRYLVITHAHGDHAGGAGPFIAAGAQLVCSESAAPPLAAFASSAPKPRLSLVTFSERLALFGGQRRVAVYSLGGAHTAGDIVVFLPDQKVLFSGDIALVNRAPYMQSADVNPKGWESTLTKLSQLEIEKVVPGHGPLGTRQAIADTYGYVKKVNEVAHLMISENVNESLIEARLRYPDIGIEAEAITPELIVNIRAVMRAESPKPASTPAKPAATPAKPAATPAKPGKAAAGKKS